MLDVKLMNESASCISFANFNFSCSMRNESSFNFAMESSATTNESICQSCKMFCCAKEFTVMKIKKEKRMYRTITQQL